MLGNCSRRSGNPVDDCWRCDPAWADNRRRLADCAVGHGRNAGGGRHGEIYVVTDSGDDPVRPAPGTLRHAVTRDEPLWIVFGRDMTIRPQRALAVGSHKTLDGRGAAVVIGDGGACLSVSGSRNVIVHGLTIRGCKPAPRESSDRAGIHLSHGDGISLFHARDVWIDHCTLEACTDGLVDVTSGSTNVTVSNCVMRHHNKAMLLGHSDRFFYDKRMRVTVAFNRFGPCLVQRMPRCRFGVFHIINNDYVDWQKYAIGGSASPSILSHGNRFSAGEIKEVAKRKHSPMSEWSKWRWISEGDLMLNGAFFASTGEPVPDLTAPSFAKPASFVAHMTASAGALSCIKGSLC